MINYKRIIPLFLSFAIFFSLVVNFAFASAEVVLPDGWGLSDFWSGYGRGGGFGRGFGLSGDYTGEELKDAYETYVSDLPATGIDSDGYLYLFASHNYVKMGTPDYYSLYCPHAESTPLISSYYLLDESAHNSFLVSFKSSYFKVRDFSLYYNLSSAPVSGYYQIMPRSVKMTVVSSDGTVYTGTTSRSAGSEKYVEQGANISTSNYFSVSISDLPASAYEMNGISVDRTIALKSFRADYSDIYYRVRPYSGTINVQNDTTYNVNTRAGSITGDYGIMGDNNQITKVDNNTIVNETNSSVYNPVTNTTTSYDSYTYDYSDRSYTFSKTDGNTTTTTTVTYGDQNITIQEGDTVYNVYYIYQTVAEDPDPSSSPSSGHTHQYSGSITQEPTCTLTGVKTFTCECGDSYTQSVAALGHNWEIKTQVPTEYDENGSLVTQGYTIYRCSRCGEEYKSEDGTAPPGSADSSSGEGGIFSKIGELLGTVFGGLFGMLEALVAKLLDGLISLATVIGEKLTAVVEMVLSWFDEIPQMFGGFLDFLGAIFPFMPTEFTLLLTFGLAAVIFIGIVKAIRR